MDLRSGKKVWQADTEPTSAMAAFNDSLLVYGDGGLCFLDWETGHARAGPKLDLGTRDLAIVGNLAVGHLAAGCRVTDLEQGRLLWEHPHVTGLPLVSDGEVVVVARDDVQCFELKTGKLVWERQGKGEFGPHGAHLPGCAWQGLFVSCIGSYLAALDMKTGKTVWRWEPTADGGLTGWYPYEGRGYYFFTCGRYMVLDLATGRVIFERELGPHVPEPVKGKKGGLMAFTRGQRAERWRAKLVVSETHAFLTNQSGQIVALERDTGEVVQVVEVDGMPVTEPIIYENRLLLTDMSPAVYCFEGAA